MARKFPNVTEAPKHVFHWMKQLNSFDDEVKAIVKPIFENGCYWIHSENVLLAMLSDSREEVRLRGVQEILKIRHDEEVRKARDKEQSEFRKAKKCSYKRQRIFIKPIPNYEDDDYPDIISSYLYEPPFTYTMSDDDIKVFQSQPLVIDISSNSVQTERCIRTMTEVVNQTTDGDKRDGWIRAIERDRKEKPRLETRSDLTQST